MSDTVVMKGTKSGIILVLDKDTDYEKLKQDVAAKFKASAAFLGEAQKAITFQGKKLPGYFPQSFGTSFPASHCPP